MFLTGKNTSINPELFTELMDVSLFTPAELNKLHDR